MLQRTMLSLLTTTVLLTVEAFSGEIGIYGGVLSTKNSDSTKLKSPTLGVTYEDDSFVLMPRVDLEYVNVVDDQADSLWKASVNGIYELSNNTKYFPYFLGGVGYESVQGSIDDVFESHPFVQAGVGLRYGEKGEYKLKLESRFLQIIGGENEENEIILTAGVSFPLGVRKQKIEMVRPIIMQTPQAPAPIIHVTPAPVYISQAKPVIQPMPIVQPTPIAKPEPKIVYINNNNNQCSIKIDLPDLDRDGVEDSIDQCPATPCNFTVDNYGCPIKATLKIHFPTNSAVIKDRSMPRVDEFAQFLLKNRGSRVNIIGHTDNVGTESNNLSLSKRRADSVKRALIDKGVSPARLSSQGMGESMPVASNDTNEGRARNRRIEAEISYPRGVK